MKLLLLFIIADHIAAIWYFTQVDASELGEKGIWAIVVLMSAAITALWFDAKKLRKEAAEERKDQLNRTLSVIDKNTESHWATKHSNDLLASAIKEVLSNLKK